MERRDFLGMLAALPVVAKTRSLHDEALAFFADRLEQRVKESRTVYRQLTLKQFVVEAWPIIEPAQPFIDNWTIDAICEHLQGVTAGTITNLLINIPPGCMKSRILVLWAAWEWTLDPSLGYLSSSYEQTLSTRDNLAVRDLVTSEWYQTNWPHVTLRKDQNVKTQFNNTRRGWRIGTSVGGRATGQHPKRKVIDDPLNVKQAETKKGRERAHDFIFKTLPTRGKALNAATVLVMQRLHEEDPSGVILEKPDGWVCLILPMRFETKRACSTVGSVTASLGPDGRLMWSAPKTWTDPRTTERELLWPALYSEQKVSELEHTLGPYGTAGQLQQRPAPESGGIFQRSWFKIVDVLPADAFVSARVRGWDGAGTDGAGDYTAGVRESMTEKGVIYIEHVVRDQVGPGADEELMLSTAQSDPKGTTQFEEQEPGSAGKKVCAAHAKALMGYDYESEPSTGDKVTRAKPLAAQMRVGNVFLVRGPWNQAFIDELCLFPNGKHDDQVDGATASFNKLALTRNTVKVVKLKGF